MRSRTIRLWGMLFLMAAVAPGLAGDLEPPGAPGPTMRPIDTIEARIPLGQPGPGEFPIVLDQPGSFYLAGDITGEPGANGIDLLADNITLDLNGYSLIGAAGQTSGNAIAVPLTVGAVENITVFGGTIRGWGGDGVCGEGYYCGELNSGDFHSLRVQQNGGNGLRLFEKATLRDCSVTDNGAFGIDVVDQAHISRCTVSKNVLTGILANARSIVEDCLVLENGGIGILTGTSVARSIIRNCHVSYNRQDGIAVSFYTLVTGNLVHGNGYNGDGAGIHVDGALTGWTRVEGNEVSGNDRGIEVETNGNLIIRNSASDNGAGPSDDYLIVSGNTVGQIVVGGTGAFTSDQPWANFSY